MDEKPVVRLTVSQEMLKTRDNLFECLLVNRPSGQNGVKVELVYAFCEEPDVTPSRYALRNVRYSLTPFFPR